MVRSIQGRAMGNHGLFLSIYNQDFLKSLNI